MKKIISLIASLMLVISLAPCVYAENVAYEIEELNLSISLPSSFSVFTRQTKADDPKLDILGIELEDMLKNFNDGNVYLDALDSLDENFKYELMVTSASNEETASIGNFSDYTVEELTDLVAVDAPDEVLEKSNIASMTNEIKVYNDMNYVYSEVVSLVNGIETYQIQNYTIIDGMAIYFTLDSSSEINDELIYAEDAIMNTVIFSNELDVNANLGEVEKVEKEPIVNEAPPVALPDNNYTLPVVIFGFILLMVVVFCITFNKRKNHSNIPGYIQPESLNSQNINNANSVNVNQQQVTRTVEIQEEHSKSADLYNSAENHDSPDIK